MTGFFGVKKIISSVEREIRVVYNATKYGLYEAVWPSNVYLPTRESALRLTDYDSWFDDLDVGEMFLNYFLDPNMRRYAGIDVTDMIDRSVGCSDNLLAVAGATVDVTAGLFNKNDIQTGHKKIIWESW